MFVRQIGDVSLDLGLFWIDRFFDPAQQEGTTHHFSHTSPKRILSHPEPSSEQLTDQHQQSTAERFCFSMTLFQCSHALLFGFAGIRVRATEF